jgi:hypothetical protein
MPSSTFGDDEFTRWYVSLNIIAFVLESIAAILSLMVMHRMKSQTAHITLLWHMTVWQFWANIFTLTSNIYIGYDWREVSMAIVIPTGIATAVISNWMVFLAWYIVINQKPFDIFPKLPWVHISAIVPGVIMDIIFIKAAAENDTNLEEIIVVDVYNICRIVSIGFNFLLIIFIIYKISNITSRSRALTKETMKEGAIRTLALRMILYPVVQAIARSAYSYYEFEYGAFRGDDDDPSDNKQACMIYLTLVTPLVSIGYLVILCVMQPKAYLHLKAIVTCRPYEEIETEYFLEHQNSLSASLMSSDHIKSNEDVPQEIPSISSISSLTSPQSSPNLSSTQAVHALEQPIRSSVRHTTTRKTTATRISDRFSEELSARLTNSAGRLTDNDWKEVFRFSMEQMDEDLCELLEEEEYYEGQRDEEATQKANVRYTMSFDFTHNMFLPRQSNMVTTQQHQQQHAMHAPSTQSSGRSYITSPDSSSSNPSSKQDVEMLSSSNSDGVINSMHSRK